MSQGLASKIESQNTYVPCAHPERRSGGLFFICHNCGTSIELEDRRIDQQLADDAAHLGFQMTRRVVEVEGICSRCAVSGTA